MSALAGTVSASFNPAAGADAMRLVRAALSLALAVAILAVALPVAFGAGARGDGVDPLQVFSSGGALSVDAAGGAELSVAGLVPGQRREASIRVSNAGSSAAQLSLATQLADRVGAGGQPLSRALAVRMTAPGGAVLYDGPLAGLEGLRLGALGAGQTRTFGFAVTLPASTGNAVQGSRLSAALSWQVG